MKNSRKFCAAMAMLLTVSAAAPSFSVDTVSAAKKAPKLSNKNLSMTVGQKKTITVKNFKKKVTWKSSKTSVAKLSAVKKKSVKVIARKKGKAKVTASFKNGAKKVKLTCKITVRAKKAVTPVVSNLTNVPQVSRPSNAPAPTVDPNATATPTPTFDYDNYANCLWKQPAGVKIKDVYSDYFMNGISTNLGSLRSGEKASLVKYHFNSVTMGNETKMESIVNDDITTEHPEGISKANVDNYYATGGEGDVILDYETLEKVLSYCKANNLKLRYHAFVWHSQVREYFFLQDYNWSDYDVEEYAAKGWDTSNYHKLADAETMKKRLNSYISQVIKYIYSHGYGDVVYAYDVINEATNGEGSNNFKYTFDENTTATNVEDLLTPGGSENTESNGKWCFRTNGGIRKSKNGGAAITVDSSPAEVEQSFRENGRVPANDSYWYATMGTDYLYLSYYYAHKAIEKYFNEYQAQYGYTVKPSLIYNDYNTAEVTQIGLVKWINKACNVTDGTDGVVFCNGIGLQSHCIGESTQERMIKRIVDEGLEVQVTELDESSGISEEAQAKKLKKQYQIYMDYSKKGSYGSTKGDDYVGVTSVTQWSICDNDGGSWDKGHQYAFKIIPEDERTDENLSVMPKPAYFGILQAAGVDCGEKTY
ncbi:MAG: endo-1,4-beta-xylanase [Lachnoclostridium sp.]|nr:endo-1,4-beta-xylanase [Lachnoclostridium sp.]